MFCPKAKKAKLVSETSTLAIIVQKECFALKRTWKNYCKKGNVIYFDILKKNSFINKYLIYTVQQVFSFTANS